MKKLKSTNGITLIALIITIIVLLILAGVSINLILGENGILQHASNAGAKYNAAQIEEEINIAMAELQSQYYKDRYTNGGKYEDGTPIGTFGEYATKKLTGEGITTASGAVVKVSGTDLTFTAGGKTVTAGTFDATTGGITVDKQALGDVAPLISKPTSTPDPVTYTISYDANGGSGAPSAQTKTHDVALTLSSTYPTKSGFSFKGWTTSSTGITVEYTAGGKYQVNRDVILYAVWDDGKPKTEWPEDKVGTPREGRDLDQGKVYDGVTYNLTWTNIAEIAKMIADTKIDSDSNNDITEDTYEFYLDYKGTTYLFGVGDRMTIDGKIVRILGFNHDELVNTGVYGGNNKYAGISFEYVESLIDERRVNPGGKDSTEEGTGNIGGWGKSEIRDTLNGTVYDTEKEKLGDGTIKKVKKQYIKICDSAESVTVCEDYLWLLSCSEVWNNGSGGESTRGQAITSEGEQYKYYKMINAYYNDSNEYLEKSVNWWLRSPGAKKVAGWMDFCLINVTGQCVSGGNSLSFGIIPGFAV